MGISIAKHRLEILKLVKKEEQEESLKPKNLSRVIKKYIKKCMNKFVFRDDEDVNKKDMPVPMLLHEQNWYQGKWKGALMKKHVSEEHVKEEKHVSMYRSRTMPYSGPLDGRLMNEKKMVNNKALKLSGPIDGRYTNRSPLRNRPVDGRFTGTTTIKSPRVSGPLDPRMLMLENRSPRRITSRTPVETDSPMGYTSPYNKPKGDFDYDDERTLWPTLFQDLNPT